MYVFNFKDNHMEKGPFSYPMTIDPIPNKELLVVGSEDHPYNWTESNPFVGREPVDSELAQIYVDHFENVKNEINKGNTNE